MSGTPPGFTRNDAFSLGLIKTIQALTAVVYRDAPERDKLESQLRIYLQSDTGLPADLHDFYKSPIEGALLIIDEIKAAQPTG
jgi:hypothetical protein